MSLSLKNHFIQCIKIYQIRLVNFTYEISFDLRPIPFAYHFVFVCINVCINRISIVTSYYTSRTISFIVTYGKLRFVIIDWFIKIAE